MDGSAIGSGGAGDGGSLRMELVASHARALRGIALSLLGDEHAADDVLQDTFVRALVSPPPRQERIGGWLARVARGLAIDRKRSEARRAEREQRYAAARPEAFDAEARGQLARTVVEAVVALREPYKTTVLLRYFEGLPPREIAARVGASVATVDSRLQRAHALLRERLERDLGSRHGGLRPALFALAGLRAPLELGAASAWAVSLGGVAVGLKSLTVGAAVVLAALFFFLALRSSSVEPAVPAAAPEVAGDVAFERSSSASTPGESVEKAAGAARGAIERPRQESLAALDEVPLRSGPYEFELEIVPLDANGHPLAVVDVYLAPERRPLNYVGSTSWEGALRLRWAGFERRIEAVLYAARDGYGSTPLRRVELVASGRQRITLALDAPPELVVADPDSGAIPMDDLVARSSKLRDALREAARREVAFALDAVQNGVFTDPWMFRVEPLGVGLDLKFDVALDYESLGRALGELGYVEVTGVGSGGGPQFSSCATIQGRAVDRKGEPVAGALASVVTEMHAYRSDTWTDGDGRFRFDGVPCGPALVLVGDREHGFDARGLERKRIELHQGESVTWNAVLEPPADLAVRLADDLGTPLVGWYVEARTAEKSDGGEFVGRAVTDAGGTATLHALGDEPLVLFARPAASPGIPKAVIAQRVRPGAGDVLVVVPGGHRLGQVEVEVGFPLSAAPMPSPHVASGLLVPGEAEVRAWRADSREGVVLARSGSNGMARTYAASGLIPGRYEIELGAPCAGWKRIGTFDLLVGRPLRVRDVVLDAPAKLTLGLVLPATSDPGVQIEIVARDQGALVRPPELTATLPATLQIAPGDYEIEVGRPAQGKARPVIVHRERVELSTGEQAVLGVALDRRPRR